MNDALNYAARHGKTQHEKIAAVQMAKMINQECGGAIIAPWEIGQLDDEWMEVFIGLTEIPKIKESYQAFDKRLEEIRRSHPNYRKYL